MERDAPMTSQRPDDVPTSPYRVWTTYTVFQKPQELNNGRSPLHVKPYVQASVTLDFQDFQDQWSNGDRYEGTYGLGISIWM